MTIFSSFYGDTLCGVVDTAEPGEAEAGDILTFARERLRFEPDPMQARLLSFEGRRVLVNCTRQWGKSTTTAVRALFDAATKPKSLIICIAPCGRQSHEFIRKVREFAGVAGIRVRGEMLDNGSRIVGLPASEARIRGFSAATLVIVDEAARVPDELYLSIRPFLAVSNGSLWVLSTPLGERGFFHDLWKNGGERWERISVPATECPRIPAAFLEEERQAQGDWRFRQEYLCEFGGCEDALFERETLLASLTREVRPLWEAC